MVNKFVCELVYIYYGIDLWCVAMVYCVVRFIGYLRGILFIYYLYFIIYCPEVWALDPGMFVGWLYVDVC